MKHAKIKRKKCSRYVIMTYICLFSFSHAIHGNPCLETGADHPFKKGAIAIWMFSDLNDATQENSRLKKNGNISFITLQGEEADASKIRGGDGVVAKFNGSCLIAGQGADNELNFNGKFLSILARVKANHITGYTPILTKAGNDQSLAYNVAFNPQGKDIYLEILLGSDDIAGAHLLKYKMPKEELTLWHDIIFRFNGEISELYVDGQLRDDEITVGDIRDWNRRPLMIGGQYRDGEGYSDSFNASPEFVFDGLIDHIGLWDRYLSDKEIMQLSGVQNLKDGRPEYYTEAYRPQFHFSAKKNWLNDPNGLVYYDGVYHMFFQYMPPHRPGAYKDWGHAISRDLIHWEQIPNHITPHKVWAGCWSGSAVVDEHNVTGFQNGDEKPIIAFITNGGHPNDGLGPMCTQCIAYSTDAGKTFTYYDKNPVIRNIHNANRDPKVVWDANSKQWIMSLYMDKECEFGLFASNNLKDWRQLSTLTLDGVTECPGFLPVPADGDNNNIKWLFFGANGKYKIGSFDGTHFQPETEILEGDFGKNFYAAMTWSNVPDGRWLHLAWMPTRRYPDMPFEQQMNFPTELTLRTTPNGLRVYRIPVREISNLYDRHDRWKNKTITPGNNILSKLKGDLYDMQFEFDMTQSSSFTIGIRGANICYNADKQEISCNGPTVDNKWADLGRATLKSIDGKVKLRILVDRTSIEIFGNDGEIVITSNFMPDLLHRSYSLSTDKQIKIISADIHSLKSIWNIN